MTDLFRTVDIDLDDPDRDKKVERLLDGKPLEPETLETKPILEALAELGIELANIRPPKGWYWGRRR